MGGVFQGHVPPGLMINTRVFEICVCVCCLCVVCVLFVKGLKRVVADVAEICSPARVIYVALEIGLKPGDSIDSTNGWDFTLQRHRVVPWNMRGR